MTDDSKKVVDINLRRIQQRKARGEQPYEDPVIQAADEISTLYGKLATRMQTQELLASIYLAERALYIVLRHAIGDAHTDEVRKQAIDRACTRYTMQWPEYEERSTVFERDKTGGDDDIPGSHGCIETGEGGEPPK